MSKVYYKAISQHTDEKIMSDIAGDLFERIVYDEQISLGNEIPLKVHFGEKGNVTFVNPNCYNGVLDYLNNNKIKSAFMETNVVYQGQRMRKDDHIKLAREHGFNRVPVIIADGDPGDDLYQVEVNKKHFKKCFIGKKFKDYNQIVVMSHFKGHALAGFGGAVKQLAMGFASRGGKLAQHANSIPRISKIKCRSCSVCANKCPEGAITINKKAIIDKDICIGCAACIANCPYKGISLNWLASLNGKFGERLVEYAYAAQKGKQYIYITFAINITKGCDCEGHKMKPFVNDLGIFASLDPVAIDKACLDLLDKREGRKVIKRGRKMLNYAETVGLGSQKYELITM